MLPLKGLFVVALEQAVAAPTCTVRLADAGARVVKIEQANGETARHYDKSVHGTSAYFAWINRGKESAVLDIKQEDDLALLKRMIAKADVFIQNFAPGAMSRLGIDAPRLMQEHDRLICVDISGYPQSSAAKNMRAYDMLIQAESGVCSVTGTEQEAVKVGVSIADVMTGMNAHAAVLEALVERSITGRGKHIEMSLFGTMADMMSVPLLHHDYGGKATPRTGLSHAAIYPYNSVSCLDGEIVVVVQNPAEWTRFCDMLGRPELARDPRFADNPSRVENREALGAIMAEVFGVLARQEAISRLEAHRLAWSNVSNVADLSAHMALERLRCELPNGETFEGVAPPLRKQIKDNRIPALGAHTQAIRKEFAN